MTNRRKGMIMFSLWLSKKEEKELYNILKKDEKNEKDIKIISNIIISSNNRGDFNK